MNCWISVLLLLLWICQCIIVVQSIRVAIVGAGPSGLLLAHKLLRQNDDARGCCDTVSIYDENICLDRCSGKSLSYVVGIGFKGRTAIQSVDMELWQAVERKVLPTDKFIVHLGPLTINLRDSNPTMEPTLLCFQSELCAVLAEELDRRWTSSGRLHLHYGRTLKRINLREKFIETSSSKDNFDLIVGCDGSNSIVRRAISELWPDFVSTRTAQPKFFKSAQLQRVPTQLDPTAVSVLLSQKIAVAVEPTISCCCVLFQGSDPSDSILSSTNTTFLEEELRQRFPLLDDAQNKNSIESCAQQLANIPTPIQGVSVQSNMYHYQGDAVLCGDAAHATIAQGLNAALQDSAVLADCLRICSATHKNNNYNIQEALLQYSCSQVPEGHALHSLAFPPTPHTAVEKIRNVYRSIRDVVFGGKFGIGQPQLQITLQTMAESFATIRRQRQEYYDNVSFPSDEEWKRRIVDLAQGSSKDVINDSSSVHS